MARVWDSKNLAPVASLKSSMNTTEKSGKSSTSSSSAINGSASSSSSSLKSRTSSSSSSVSSALAPAPQAIDEIHVHPLSSHVNTRSLATDYFLLPHLSLAFFFLCLQVLLLSRSRLSVWALPSSSQTQEEEIINIDITGEKWGNKPKLFRGAA